jgi:hypothetical protein
MEYTEHAVGTQEQQQLRKKKQHVRNDAKRAASSAELKGPKPKWAKVHEDALRVLIAVHDRNFDALAAGLRFKKTPSDIQANWKYYASDLGTLLACLRMLSTILLR